MQIDAYLQRIAYAGNLRPSADVLEALHLAHATHIPFENLDILRGLPIRLDLESLQRKLVDARRGGYCFEQNLLFAAVLEEVGFHVTRLAARVRYRATSVHPRTHMLLLVDTDAGQFLADVGFGAEGLLLPVPFDSGQESQQFAWTYRVTPDGPVWVLQSKHAEGWTDMYGFTLEPQLPVDYEVANHFTSTHPESRFVKGLTVQLPRPEARTALRNRELSVDDGKTTTARVLENVNEIRRAIEDTFGLPAPPDLRIRANLAGAMKVLASILTFLPALVFAQSTSVSVTPPTVTGPIALTSALKSPAHGYPYNAAPIDLAKAGYLEEEFFIEGTASQYNTPPGERGTLIDGGHPYKTRIVVRRPRQASRFNGTAILEWYNVSQGHDGEFEWFQSHDHFVSAGYAWVGVSNQAVGVNSLKEWSPARYGTLDVSQGGTIMGDALSYDIFTAAAMAVRGKGSRDVMGGLRPARLIAAGHSQSAGRLYTYVHSVHPLGVAVYDAVILHGGGGKVSPTLSVKVFKYLDETDVVGQRNNSQPDTDSYRQWEVAGSSHLDAQFSRALAALGLRVSGMTPVEGSPSIEGPSISGGDKGNGGAGNGAGVANDGPNGGCALPPFSRVPSYHALNAAFDHVAKWVKDGTPPPTSPRIDLKQTGTRWEYVRDEVGLARGGIRLAAMDAPIATNTGTNSGGQAAGGERNCGLMGSSQPFDEMRLAMLYPTHAAYVERVKDVTEKNLRAGFILKPEADATIREAERSNVGRSRTGTK